VSSIQGVRHCLCTDAGSSYKTTTNNDTMRTHRAGDVYSHIPRNSPFDFYKCSGLGLCCLKGNFEIFYMLAKYVPGDIKYIFTKLYRHISTNNEANRKFVILFSYFFMGCDMTF
jgi:hypothetical protein